MSKSGTDLRGERGGGVRVNVVNTLPCPGGLSVPGLGLPFSPVSLLVEVYTRVEKGENGENRALSLLPRGLFLSFRNILGDIHHLGIPQCVPYPPTVYHRVYHTHLRAYREVY